ncbi:MAG: hypothetical protein KKB13_15285, partial [Chloroflexi bacterium]|nr:hypothetical protein [Chloroflexota bacterium]
WVTQVQEQIKVRENQYLSVKHNEIAPTPDEAIGQVHTYLDTVKTALGDRKVSPEEMTKIAQQGANASASLQAHGGANTQNLVNGIDKMTRELARGEWPQANKNMGSFEASVPKRPEPSKPQPPQPQPPTRR